MPLLTLPFLRPRPQPVDRYAIVAVTSVAEFEQDAQLPIEIRFVLTQAPELRTPFRALLKEGYGLGVRRVERTPARMLQAVDRIAERTQGNTVLPWLPTLLEKEEVPLFTREELERAHAEGIDLYEEARVIADARETFRKIVLIDLHDRRIREEHQAVLRQANAALASLAVAAMVHRVVGDRSRAWPKTGSALAKAVFFIGPLAHLLERWVPGMGKVFAALADDLLAETAELVTLRQSGLTWRQLMRRGWLLIPVVVLVAVMAFQVEPLLQAGHVGWAGALFGLSAAFLSLVAVVESMALYRGAYARLVQERKVMLGAGQSLWGLALRQFFVQPAQFGLLLGALLTPLSGAVVFATFPAQTGNGWVLALIACTEMVVAMGVVWLAGPFLNRRFHRKALPQHV